MWHWHYPVIALIFKGKRVMIFYDYMVLVIFYGQDSRWFYYHSPQSSPAPRHVPGCQGHCLEVKRGDGNDGGGGDCVDDGDDGDDGFSG